MAREYADLVQDTATTAGTGPWTMANAAKDGFQPFGAAHTLAATFDYTAWSVTQAGAQVERGEGTLTAANKISRAPHDGVLVNFSTPPVVFETVNSRTFRALATTAQVDAVAAGIQELPVLNPDDVGFDIVLCVGQSNMAGRGTFDALIDMADSRVWQFGADSAQTAYYRKIFSGADPLHMAEGIATNKTGPATSFARTYAAAAPSNRRVLLIPLAEGGTGLTAGASNPKWLPGNPGGTRYENAITQTNLAITAAKALYPNSRVAGAIWVQGENDAINSVTQSDYAAALKALIAGFRSRITGAADSWFIIGGMVPEQIANFPTTYNPIVAAQQQVAAETDKVAYVPGPAGFAATGDQIHYKSEGSRILGARMALAVQAAKTHVGVVAEVTVPAQMAAPTATAGVASASIAFVAPADGGAAISGYTVTASTGQTATGTSSPIVITIPAGVAATFTITATNSAGTSAPSPASNSVTPTASATVPATMAAPTVTAGDGTISVAYVAPSNGGAAITGYTATWSGGQSVSGTANPLAITGVANGTAGTATIYATNSVGNGAPSPASNSVTPQAAAVATAPGAPTIGTATAGEGYIDVAFTAPASNGGSAILDYTATLSTGQTATGTVSPIRVAAPAGTPATATVTARNSVGSSAPSSASNSATPTAPAAEPTNAYTFTNDTVGAAPAGMTATSGTLEVVDTGVTGWTGKYLHFSGPATADVYRASLDNIPAAADRTVTWRRGVSQTAKARDCIVLRVGEGNASGIVGAKHGYAFQVSGPHNQLRLYKFGVSTAATIGTNFALNDVANRWFRASAIGTTLKFEYSDDGVNWVTAIETTDTTHTTGGVDYVNGFGTTNTPSSAYIDNIAWS